MCGNVTEFSDAAGNLMERCLFFLPAFSVESDCLEVGVKWWANHLVVRGLLVCSSLSKVSSLLPMGIRQGREVGNIDP